MFKNFKNPECFVFWAKVHDAHTQKGWETGFIENFGRLLLTWFSSFWKRYQKVIFLIKDTWSYLKNCRNLTHFHYTTNTIKKLSYPYKQLIAYFSNCCLDSKSYRSVENGNLEITLRMGNYSRQNWRWDSESLKNSITLCLSRSSLVVVSWIRTKNGRMLVQT